MRQFVERGTPATIEIIGCDGSLWTVAGDDGGHEGVELNTGPQGLQEAPRSGIWQQSAWQEGATFLGATVEPLDLVLSFQIWGDEENWQDVASRFRAAWDYEKQTTIRVTTESGTRELDVQLFEAPQRDSEKDPRFIQYSLDMFTVRAAWPFWRGEDYSDSFTVELHERPVEDDSAWGKLSAALRTLLKLEPEVENYSEGYVTIANPTDVPMWPQWACTAPGRWGIPDFSFEGDTVTKRSITTPTLAAGEDLSIDTYPRNEPYVAANGSNVAGRFGGVLFLNPIPPKTPPTKVPVVYVGDDAEAAATVRLREYWNGPWGGE